jgi:hypothetical protein
MIAKNKNKNLSLKLYSMFENIGGRCGAMRGNYTVWRRKIPLFYYSKNNGTEVRREMVVHLYEQLFIRKSINKNSVVFGTCSGEHVPITVPFVTGWENSCLTACVFVR